MSANARTPSIARLTGAWMLGCCLLAQPALASDRVVELGMGVLHAPPDDQIYASDPVGHVHALRVADGQTRWVSADRARPLALHQGRLVALAAVDQFGLGQLLLLDPADGQMLDRIAFDLPEAVSVELVDRPQRHFRMQATAQAQGLRLHWQYESRPLRGAALDADTDPAAAVATQSWQGAFELLSEAQGHRLLPLPADTPAPARGSGPELAQAVRLPQLAGRQFQTAPEHAILHSVERVSAERGVDYQWELLAPAGQRLGQLHTPFAYAPFMVQDGVLVYRVPAHGATDGRGLWSESPPQLIGWDLQQSRELWRFAVLDAEYRGPMPP